MMHGNSNDVFYVTPMRSLPTKSPIETNNEAPVYKKPSMLENREHPPKLVFVVPYRDREQQLLFFQRHMKYILEDLDENDYQILIVHQTDTRSFNCGAMKNIGFLIVREQYPEHYKNITLVFNDVDTLPFNKDFLPYETVAGNVKHFYGFKHTLGGIVSINAGDFENINGFPNFWAWGYEDNMLYERVNRQQLHIDRNVFFPFADKNILHFYDGYTKPVNKAEFDRYSGNTREGVHSIHNLRYSFNKKTGLCDITSFDTGIIENTAYAKMHDLHNGTTPFTSGRGRGTVMQMRR